MQPMEIGMDIFAEGVHQATCFGDPESFYKGFKKLCQENEIVKYFISSQFAQMPNPVFKSPGGFINPGQPEFINGVLITAVIYLKKKPDEEKKVDLLN